MFFLLVATSRLMSFGGDFAKMAVTPFSPGLLKLNPRKYTFLYTLSISKYMVIRLYYKTD